MIVKRNVKGRVEFFAVNRVTYEYKGLITIDCVRSRNALNSKRIIFIYRMEGKLREGGGGEVRTTTV